MKLILGEIKMSTSFPTKEIWLTYFNNLLFEKGIITEDERNKMSCQISNHCHKTNR